MRRRHRDLRREQLLDLGGDTCQRHPQALLRDLYERRREIQAELPLLELALQEAQQEVEAARCAEQELSRWAAELRAELGLGPLAVAAAGGTLLTLRA